MFLQRKVRVTRKHNHDYWMHHRLTEQDQYGCYWIWDTRSLFADNDNTTCSLTPILKYVEEHSQQFHKIFQSVQNKYSWCYLKTLLQRSHTLDTDPKQTLADMFYIQQALWVYHVLSEDTHTFPILYRPVFTFLHNARKKMKHDITHYNAVWL